MMLGLPFIKKVGQLKSYYGYEEWCRKIREKVGDHYVIMIDGFQNPSKYNFNENILRAFSYDARYYRRTQYDLWPIEDSLQHKRAFFLLSTKTPGFTTDSIQTGVGTWYGLWVDNVRTYQKINIEVPQYNIEAKGGDRVNMDLLIKNPYPFAIDFSDKGYTYKVELEACVYDGLDLLSSQAVGEALHQIALRPGQSTHLRFDFNVPKLKGKYDLYFSFRTDPFPGGKNNRVINLTIN